jgi:predicted DNA-binding transcriptional regulator AlpA
MNLVGLTEIAAMLGVTRQRASQLSRQKGFPPPLDRIAAGPVWREDVIKRWAERRKS